MLIGLHAKKRHGKSTIAQHLVARHGFVRLPLARALKDSICADLLRLRPEHIEGELKEVDCVTIEKNPGLLALETVVRLFPRGGLRYGLSPAELEARWTEIWEPLCDGRAHSPRAVMQAVGGGARARISPQVWIDLWRDAYRWGPGAGGRDVVVDDVRYPNEKQFLEGERGEVWRVVRTDLADSGDLDASETACDHLPDAAFGAVVRRATGVPGLLDEIDRLLAVRRAHHDEASP